MKPHLWLIAVVSQIVPRRLRSDWKQEWEGELHYREARMQQWDASTARRRGELMRRSLGALQDALWLQPKRLEEDVRQDLRYGARMLGQHKTWTAVAVLSLALGIGANTALFSVADEVLLKPLPVKNPHELVLFSWTSGPQLMGGSFSPGVFIDPVTGASTSRAFSYLAFEGFRTQSRTLSDAFAFTGMFRALPTNDDPDPPVGQMVSGNYYRALGVTAVAGRTLTPEDDQETAPAVAMISSRYWKTRFALDPAVVGRTIALGRTPVTIVGVTPPGFSGTQNVGESPDITVPLALAVRARDVVSKFAADTRTQPWLWALMIMGRAKPGVSEHAVRGDLQGIFQATATEGWRASPRRRPTVDTPTLVVESGAQGLTADRQALTSAVVIMSIVVALVLLIVCTNLINLLLARSATRREEIAVRIALGAPRGRLIRQLLTESLLLSAVGASMGALLAWQGKDLFLTWLIRRSPSLALEPEVNLRTLAFTSAVTVLTGLIVGVAPAFAATRVSINPAVPGSGRIAARPRSLLSRSLLVAQVAMSIVLLVGAGLFVRTLINLRAADVGFNAKNLLVFSAMPRRDKDPRAEQPALITQVSDRIRAVPGVRSVTNSGYPMLSGDLAMPFIVVPGRTRPEGESAEVYDQTVWDNFFETLEMPILIGRSLSAQDRTERRPYVVVNETLARKYFGGRNPIGQRFGFSKDASATIPDKDDLLVEIVGVVRDAKYTTVRQAPPPTVYRAYQPGPVTFAVRTAGDPMALAGAVRQAVQDIDRDLVLTGFRPQLEIAALTFARERHFAWLSSIFGVLALALACIGLYGLMSYNVTNRTREIGVRMALGAERWTVVRLVTSDTLLTVVIGVVLGLAGSVGLTQLIAKLLFGLTPTDTQTLTLAIGLMVAVAAAASYLPARRATRVNPVVALRCE